MIANVIILGIIVVFVVFALKSVAKHLKGESACCGGGGGVTIAQEKTLAEPILETKTIKIDGMTCKNCSAHVQNSLNKIEGLSAKVDLKKANAVLSMSRKIDDDEIKRAVEGAGYKIGI